MSAVKQGGRSLLPKTRRTVHSGPVLNQIARAFSTTPSPNESLDQQSSSQSTPSTLEPHLVHTPKLERRLLRAHNSVPIGSRRRRAALQSGSQIPFEQLPYQCFQEARKILASDREEKVKHIESQRARLERLRATKVEPQADWMKEQRIKSISKHLEELKIFADINDPIVKKRYEDGQGRDIISSYTCLIGQS